MKGSVILSNDSYFSMAMPLAHVGIQQQSVLSGLLTYTVYPLFAHSILPLETFSERLNPNICEKLSVYEESGRQANNGLKAMFQKVKDIYKLQKVVTDLFMANRNGLEAVDHALLLMTLHNGIIV